MRRWLKRFALLLLIFAALECTLRLLGHIPGYTGNASGEFLNLQGIDTLIQQQTFKTDARGIFLADASQFSDRPGVRINSEGFRGAEFTPLDSGDTRKKVLLLGDSFTWGANAQPITQSFADLLDSSRYRAYNTGIPGTEPDQYARIAEMYIPQLNPDAVCVFFYMANDVMYRPLEVGPFQNRYHITQAGWFNAFLDGNFQPNAKSAFDYYQKRYSIPQSSAFGRFCSLTATGTLAWRILRKWGWISEAWHPEVAPHIKKAEKETSEHPISYHYLKSIQQLAEAQGAKFYLFVIPVHTDLQPEISDLLFREIPYHIPGQLKREHYREWPDGHFNNEGHRIFANFLEQVLGGD